MANDILIIPASASIEFSGSAANTIRLQVEDSGSVAFYGKSGSLFGISDNLSGSLMSVNDLSGLPTLETFSDGKLVVSPYAFQVRSMGFGTDTPIGNFDFVNPLAENVDFYIRTTQGSSYDTALHIRGSRTTSTTDELANIRFETADTDASGVEMARISAIKDVASTNIARLEFKTTTTDGGSPTTKMMISSSGNVGIGNTTPTHTLSVTGDISASGDVTASAFSGEGSQVTGVVSSSYALTASYAENGGGGGAVSSFLNEGNDNYVITSTGTNGEINAESNLRFDGSKLTVTGDISASGDVSGSRLHIRGRNSDEFLGLFVSGNVTPEPQAAGSPGNTLSVQGSNQALFHGRDVTNNIDFLFGTSVNGVAFMGSYTSHDVELRRNGTTKLTIKDTEISSSNIPITASGFWGDGSQVTGVVSSSYSNTASYVETAQTASYFIGDISFPSGLEVTGSLLLDGSMSASGDITASVFSGDGSQLTNLVSANLDNNSVSYGGVSLNLGQTDATPAFNLTDATSLPIVAGTTGTLTVARGGTGRTTLDSNQLLTGDGTNAVVSEGNLTFDGSKLTVTGEVSASGDGVFDGLVGIGLSSPIVPLHISRVAGSSTFTRFTREDLTNESWDMRISSAGVLEIRSVEDAGTSVLTPFRIEHATGEIWMTTGNVGIGTTSPTADLHISGSTADNDIFYVQGGTTDIIFASGSGNVGIGTITPDQALHVVGEIVATGEITAFYSSDERLKENIQILSTPLTKLTSLRGVEFDWTDEHIDSRGGLDKLYVQKHDVGVIAQEVEKVLPEVVVDRDDGYKAVRYEKMIPLLIEAIKELKTELDEVKQNCRCNSQLEE